MDYQTDMPRTQRQAIMYCHNTQCRQYNNPQGVTVDHYGFGDLECERCQEDLHNGKHDGCYDNE